MEVPTPGACPMHRNWPPAAQKTEVMLSEGWKTARKVEHYAAGAKAERRAVAKYL